MMSSHHQDDQIPYDSSEDSLTIPTLPLEIVVEILSRLPVSSLLQFRSVCKSWRSLISDPHFVESHLRLSTMNDQYAHHRLIFNPEIYIKSCHLYDVLNVDSVETIDHYDYPLEYPDCFVRVVGSCDGLVCITTEEEDENEDDHVVFYIWNPATRRSNRLPICGLTQCCMFGFGFDELSEDYKVAVILFVGKNGARYAYKLMIYSLKTGNWKEIGDNISHYLPWGDSIKFVSGALCWAGRDWKSRSWKIISLDLAAESYGEVLEPIYDEGDLDDFNKSLGVLGQQLCVLCNYHGNRADVWIMKEYSTRGSWTKLVTLPYLTEPRSGQHLQLLWNFKEGKILFQSGSQLVVYDPKNNSLTHIHNLNVCFEAYTYVESLVSPDG